MSTRSRLLISTLAVVHVLVAAWHGSAHESLRVTLPPAKMAFVYLVIILAPLVAAVMIWRPHVRPAVLFFLLSMLGSFLFGVYHHYVAVSMDHIHHLPTGSEAARTAFVRSAGVLALLEFVSSVYAAAWLRATKKRSQRHS